MDFLTVNRQVPSSAPKKCEESESNEDLEVRGVNLSCCFRDKL